MVCAHRGDARFPQSTLCIPLSVQGEQLGALTVRLSRDAVADTLAAHRHLAAAASEHIALALANIRLRDTLRGQSIHDPLTGLYNRRYLEEAYRQAEANAARSGQPLAIVMIDVDHFKHFNDSFGHEAGDLVLHNLGALLKASVREGDTACRFGGEEFALLLPGASLDDGVARAEELRQTIAAELQLTFEGRMLDPVTASFGVAAYPQAGRTLRALARAADEALYVAKAAGRNRVAAASSATPDTLDPAAV
jgi:diguanylate cyclase (GGDEF)-like protein